MFSQTMEYALRAVVCLATSTDQSITTHQIARDTKIPASYLSKVLQTLGRAGIVRSRRGLHGGFLLAKAPEDLTILDVVNAVDPIQRVGRCPLELEEHSAELCPVHRRLDEALAEIEKGMERSTVAELILEGKAHSSRCCLDPELPDGGDSGPDTTNGQDPGDR
jgi:Rrf2 family protein